MRVGALASQAGWHVVARAGSSASSFLLFALIARKLPDALARRALFALFALGFGIATLRLFLHLASGVEGDASSTRRLDQARRGLRSTLRILPFALPVIGVMVWSNTGSVLVAAVCCAVAGVAALDGDLFRSIVHRGPLFSGSFAVGSLFALVGLYLRPNPSLEDVCLWMLVPWLPVALGNVFSLHRWGRLRRLPAGRGAHAQAWLHLTSLLLLAIFDGLILNAPFMGWFTPSAKTGIDLTLIVRVFVASLPLQPLLLHWANSPALGRLARALHVSAAACFSLLLCVSGLGAGSLFFLTYGMVSGKSTTIMVFLLYMVLLASYSLYAAQMRFNGPRMRASHRLINLGGVAVTYLGCLWVLRESLEQSTWAIVVLQCLALLGANFLLRVRSPEHGGLWGSGATRPVA